MTKPAPIRNDADGRAYLELTGRWDGLPLDERGRVVRSLRCGRCGGSGYGPWLRDGGVCYECDGANTVDRVQRISVKTYAQEARRRDSAARRRVEQAARERAARLDEAERALAADPELAAALAIQDHPILADLESKLREWGQLSEAQAALAKRIAAELEQAGERTATVPTGRVDVEGEVIGAKWRANRYGEVLKITLRVDLPDGTSYRVWGSCPAGLEEAFHAAGSFGPDGLAGWIRGQVVRFRATLEQSEDEGFGFFKRPTGAEVVEREVAA